MFFSKINSKLIVEKTTKISKINLISGYVYDFGQSDDLAKIFNELINYYYKWLMNNWLYFSNMTAHNIVAAIPAMAKTIFSIHRYVLPELQNKDPLLKCSTKPS